MDQESQQRSPIQRQQRAAIDAGRRRGRPRRCTSLPRRCQGLSAPPELKVPNWRQAYRLVSSSFPPISIFEDVLDPADLEQAYLIEGLTNDRLREEAGLLSHVATEDRISGPGSSPLMAAFTHVGAVSRFTAV